MERQGPRLQSTQQTPPVPSSGARLSSAMEVPCLHPPDASVTPTPAAVCCQVSPRANADTESEGLGETDPREGGMCQRTRCS